MLPYFKLGMDKKVIAPYRDYLDAMKPDFKYVGDREQIKDLVRCLYLPSASSTKVVGKRGAGMTTLLDAFVYHQTDDFMPDEIMTRPIFRLSTGNLFNTSDTKAIEAKFNAAMDELKRYGEQRQVKPILVIDNGMDFAEQAPRHALNTLMEIAVNADLIDVIVGVDEKSEIEFNKKHQEFADSFTTLELKEPSEETLLEMLEFQAQKHAAHGVIVSEDTRRHIIDITNRFTAMYDTAQPNRAIRLLDAAATAFRLDLHSRPPGVKEKEEGRDQIKAQLATATEGTDTLQSQLETLELEIKAAYEEWDAHRDSIKKKQKDIRDFDALIAQTTREIEDLDQATRAAFYGQLKDHIAGIDEGDESLKGRKKADVLKLDEDSLLKFCEFDMNVNRNPRVRDLTQKLAGYSEAVKKHQKDLTLLGKEMHVSADMPSGFVDKIASEVTKSPVGGVSGILRENLRNGVERMEEVVFGQTHVIVPIISALRRAAAGLNDPDRPLGVFMIAGPPGVGKTFLGECMAKQLFGSKDYLIIFDMENYKGEHTVATLIGAPPGYAGYGKKGLLVEAIQNNPFCVLLLDEIEKAHPEVRQALLKARGSGRLVGLDGEVADFRNVIIVETTNYGQDIWVNHDFETACSLVTERMRTDTGVFSPEYLNRNDGILFAGPLNQDALEKIVKKEVETIAKKSARLHPDLSIVVRPEDLGIFTGDYCLSLSGRQAKMAINKVIADPVADIKLAETKASGMVQFSYNRETKKFDFEYERGAAPGLILPASVRAEFQKHGPN